MTNVKVYNAVTFDGVDAYVIKTLGQTEQDVYDTFKNTDMEVLKIEELYTWTDLDEHIKGSWFAPNGWELADGNVDLKLAILRYIELKTGICLQ